VVRSSTAGFESNTIVAVTSFGLNAYCRGVDFAYRTDTAAVLEWIEDTVGEEPSPISRSSRSDALSHPH
jgi:hypothetical protein